MQFKCPSEVGTCISWDEKKAVNTKKNILAPWYFLESELKGERIKKIFISPQRYFINLIATHNFKI